jgi:hypothetical protein
MIPRRLFFIFPQQEEEADPHRLVVLFRIFVLQRRRPT